MEFEARFTKFDAVLKKVTVGIEIEKIKEEDIPLIVQHVRNATPMRMTMTEIVREDTKE